MADGVALAYPAVALAIPSLFVLTRDSRLDAWIGALSYPVYLAHFALFEILKGVLGSGDLPLGFTLAALIAAAAVLDFVVARPVDMIRIQFGARSTIAPALSAARQMPSLP
jgi:peptidoglycan/LPS O-acetylase OafA/YrhL